jgi:hypothetical protein
MPQIKPPQINQPTAGKFGYCAFYSNGHTHMNADVWADTLFQAKERAVAYFKPPKSKQHLVTVMLAEKNGEPVVHVADF